MVAVSGLCRHPARMATRGPRRPAFPVLLRMTDSVVIVFQPTEALDRRAIRASTDQHRVLHIMKIVVMVSPLLLVAISVAAGATLWQAIVLHFFWIILGPLFVFVAMPLSYWYLARKAWLGVADVTEREFTVSDEGVSIAHKGPPSRIAWAEIRKVAETPQFMLFFLSLREA